MRHLRIVGDGERDAATLPSLLRGILRTDFQHTSSPWPRLQTGEKKTRGFALRGYGRKLLYVLRGARADDVDGVVATIDADKERRGRRLKQMKEARKADRADHPPLPTAVGEARPHNEAWLLDDQVAVREALNLPRTTHIPSPRESDYPKHSLEDLHRQSQRSDEAFLTTWADIAGRVDERRCNHKAETGFEDFIAEVRSELGPLFRTNQ